MTRIPGILLAGLLSLAASPLLAGESPLDWLERMSTATSQMSYQGTFVYQQNDRMETMRITHVAGEDGVRERLVSLSGSGGEVLRDSNGVRWVLGDSASVLSDSALDRPLFPVMPVDLESLAGQSYRVGFGGDALVAGQAVRKIQVLPRDPFRYGYAFWLEKHSGLLLQWELLGSDGRPRARLMFTDIRLGAEVDRSELEPGHAMKNFQAVATDLPRAAVVKSVRPRWEPARIPTGFVMTMHRYQDGSKEGQGEFEHLVYSDGMAAVSVYVEEPVMRGRQPERIERHGTTHTFSGVVNGKKVTVVGDVPAATVRLIGKSVRPTQAP